jgi:hypothetical protein
LPARRRSCLAVRSSILRQGGLLQGLGNWENRRCRLARYRSFAIRSISFIATIGRSSSGAARNNTCRLRARPARHVLRRSRACPGRSHDFRCPAAMTTGAVIELLQTALSLLPRGCVGDRNPEYRDADEPHSGGRVQQHSGLADDGGSKTRLSRTRRRCRCSAVRPRSPCSAPPDNVPANTALSAGSDPQSSAPQRAPNTSVKPIWLKVIWRKPKSISPLSSKSVSSPAMNTTTCSGAIVQL